VGVVVQRMNQTPEVCPIAGLGGQHKADPPGPVQRQLGRRMFGPPLKTPNVTMREEGTEVPPAVHRGCHVVVDVVVSNVPPWRVVQKL